MPVGIGVDSRRSTRATFSAALSTVVLLGAAAQVHGQSPETPVPRRPLGQGVSVYQPAPGDAARRDVSFPNPTGDMSLRDAVALALMHSPGLASFAWEVRALEARVLQSGRPPNPRLEFVSQDFGAARLPGSNSDQPVQPQTTFQLSQLIELGGKRAARMRLSAADRDLGAWDYEAARMDVLTDVSRAFTDVLAAQETLAQINEMTRLAEQTQQTVVARVTAGEASPIEETRATVALASIRLESAQVRRALDASRIRLSLLWGNPAPAFTAVAGNLRVEPAALPAMQDLIARLDQNPNLKRWATELSRREAALAVERSKRVVDMVATTGYRRYTTVDSHAWVAGASVSLPLFDRNRAGIEEAQSRLAKVSAEQRAAQARLMAALADAYAALATAHDEATALRTSVLPGAQQAFDAVSEGYRLGRFGYLDVLEAQRTLVAAGHQHLQALSAYRKAVASVERLTGSPLGGDASLQTTGKE